MKRYSHSMIKQREGTRKKPKHKYQSTTLYNSIPHKEEDIWVVTQYGDRLDLIANQFYGDKSLWWYIAKANGLKVNKVAIGTILRVPVTTEFARTR